MPSPQHEFIPPAQNRQNEQPLEVRRELIRERADVEETTVGKLARLRELMLKQKIKRRAAA